MASSSEADRELMPGRRLADRYAVERLVARGGMAHVYEARDERLDRQVAIKVLASPYADDPAYVRRFLDESRTAASITHPNLAHVYDSGEDGGVRFIVLELLDGYRSLRDEIAERGRLPVDEVVHIGREVLAGLAPLHAHGLIHCDVKPGNVLIGRDGVKLIDFGIARPLKERTAGATSIGSLHSMSPEQLRGDELTASSDIFAVGAVMYQAIAGRVPFAGDTPADVAAAHAAGPPTPPGELTAGVPERLDAVILQALQPDPARRFASAEAMDAALSVAAPLPAAGDVPAIPSDEPPHEEETTTFVPVARGPRRPATYRRSGPSPVLITGIVLLLAVPVVVAAVLIGGFGPRGEPADASTDSATPRPTRSVAAAGKVTVPDTIGLSEQQAEEAARSAGLAWRLEWQVDPSKPAGVYDQDPPAGTKVDEGAPFVMFAYRTR
jgi:eukaryotic-like serine/threonine-protein kinase